jgi:hypothetical protein|tara:strand:+ start:425 stop:661 length:237 start_codon:yes stop_codon:yes gene_type:complete
MKRENRIPAEFSQTGTSPGKRVTQILRDLKKGGYEIKKTEFKKTAFHDGVEIYSALRWQGNHWIVKWDTRYFKTEVKS